MSSLFAAAKFGFFGFAAVPPQATYPGSPYELPKGMGGIAEEEPQSKGFRPYRSPPNPGKYEDLSREAKDFLGPQTSGELFDGVRLVFQRNFTPSFVVTHSVSMGQSEPAPPSSYAFIAQYAKKGFSMMGRTDADFNVSARVNVDVTPNLTTRFSADMTQDGERDYMEVDTEYKGSDWTGQLKYQSHGPIFAVTYAQGISKKFSAGLEAMFAPKMGKSFFAGQVRYAPTRRDIFTGLVSSMGLTEFSYVRAVTSQLKVASSLTFAQNEEGQIMSLWSAGYVFDFFGHMTVKGAVVQLSEVNVLVEEKLSDAISVSLSGRVNYPQNEYKFGLGASLTL